MSTVLGSVQDFMAMVRKSGLIEAAKLEAFERQHLGDIDRNDPTTLAAKLVRHQLLTNFQAKSLLTGKYKGFMLGQYRILEPIGAGGMSVVFLAEHADLKRRVALKILPAHMAKDQITLERFYREARAAAQLDHPNIVRIHDIQHGGGLHFIVMEYVEGVTLHDLLTKIGPLNHHQAAGYMAQAAAGLQHAHDKGFVHRDIKPSNLILDKQGQVKILDMGLAKSYTNEKDSLTQQIDEHAIVGTVDIISPEQALNDPVDHRSDIYSLGATMFMLMSGKPPFDGTTAQKLMQHQIKDAPSLTAIRQAIPPMLSKIVIRMMAKKPDDRYQSASEIIEALQPWLRDSTPSLDLDAVLPHQRDVAATSTIRSSLQRTVDKHALRQEPVKPPKKKSAVLLAVVAGLFISGASIGAWQIGLFDEKPDSPLGPDVANANTPNPPPNNGVVVEPPKKTPEPPKKTPPTPPKIQPTTPPALLDGNSLAATAVNTLGVGAPQSLALPAAPDLWKLQVWKSDSAGEWGIDEAQGQRLLWFRSPKGDGAMELATVKPVMPNGRTNQSRLKITYRTEGDTPAVVSVRSGRAHTDETHHLLLSPSPDRLRTVVFDLRGERESPSFLVFKNGNKQGQKFYLARVEMEAAVGQLPIIKLEAKELDPFKETVEPKQAMSTILAKGIRGWSLNSWKDGAVEAETTQLDGQRCLALNTTSGTPSLQLVNSGQVPRTKAGRYYTATMEYRAEPNTRATLQLRRGSLYGDRVAEQLLAPTEAWRTVSITYDATDEHPLLVFLQNTSPNGERLYVKSLRVTEETLDASAGQRILQPIDLSKIFNANSTEMIFSPNVKVSLDLGEVGVRRMAGLPFRIPQAGPQTNNLLIMYSRQGSLPPTLPKSIEIPVDASANKIHFLGGVSGWGYPFAQDPTKPNSNRGVAKGVVSVIVRIVYADGKTEDVQWRNGVDLFDYNKRKIDDLGPKVIMEIVPNPPPANAVPRQLRHVVITPKRTEKIQRLELMKGGDDEYTSPIIVAVTVER